MERAIDTFSIFDAGWREADIHKWLLSEQRGYDVGSEGTQHWVRHFWNRFLRSRWLEHLWGTTFWLELNEVDFGLLKRKFQDSKLLQPILEQLLNGGENLNVILWALECGHPMDEVREILADLHVNSLRLEFQFKRDMADLVDETERRQHEQQEHEGSFAEAACLGAS